MTLSSKGGSIKIITGLQFQIQGAEPTKKLWNMVKKALIKEIKKEIKKKRGRRHWNIFSSVEMPCGEFLILKTPKAIMDLPICDIPCPCGDKTHWLVRFVAFPN